MSHSHFESEGAKALLALLKEQIAYVALLVRATRARRAMKSNSIFCFELKKEKISVKRINLKFSTQPPLLK